VGESLGVDDAVGTGVGDAVFEAIGVAVPVGVDVTGTAANDVATAEPVRAEPGPTLPVALGMTSVFWAVPPYPMSTVTSRPLLSSGPSIALRPIGSLGTAYGL
jgi:hypothetical protein